MVDVTTARAGSQPTTLDSSVKRRSTSHPERTHDKSATRVVCRKMKVEENPDLDSSDLCSFILFKDVQILVTCSDNVAPIGQKKDNPHAWCTNFISGGFGPWCQNLEVKVSRRSTSFASQGSGATNAVAKEKTYLGSGVTWRRGAWTDAWNTKTKSGFNRQQLPLKDKGAKPDGVSDRRPSTTPCPYVFRHHKDISDYIADYRLHHTVRTTSTKDRNSSVSSLAHSRPRPLKEKKLRRGTSSSSSAGTSSNWTRTDTMEKRTRSIPNLSPLREKTTEPDRKGRPKANKASEPSTDQPSKCRLQYFNNNSSQMEQDNGRQPMAIKLTQGTSLTSQQSSSTKTNVLDTKCMAWPTAIFPSLHKLAISEHPSEGGRAYRKEYKVKVKHSNQRRDAREKLKQDSGNTSLNDNKRHPQREERLDDGGEEYRTQKGSNIIAVATTDKNNSRYTEGAGKGEADHPHLGHSSFPEVSSHHPLSLTQILQGTGARVGKSKDVTMVGRATGGSHHVCSLALTRSVHEGCTLLQVTDPSKVKNTPASLANQVHDFLHPSQCLSFPELQLSCMSKPQITASSSCEVSDMTRRHKHNRAGVREEGMWGGRDWVAYTQVDVAKEANISEETRNRARSDGDRSVSTNNPKHATQKGSVDNGGKTRHKGRGNAKRRTIDHLRAMDRTASSASLSSKNIQLSVVAQSLGVLEARNREQRTTGKVHIDFRVSEEAVQKIVAGVTICPS